MKRLERVDGVIHTYNGCVYTSTQHQQAQATDLRCFEAEACLGLLGGGALCTCCFLLPVVQERAQGDAFQRRLQRGLKLRLSRLVDKQCWTYIQNADSAKWDSLLACAAPRLYQA